MKVITGKHYLAFVLDEETRKTILELYPQRFEVVRCDHITVAYSFTEADVPLLQDFVDRNHTMQLNCFIQADGIDLFRVLANGKISRPLGGWFHLTYTRSESRESSDSNRVFSGEIKAEGMYSAGLKLGGTFQLVPLGE